MAIQQVQHNQPGMFECLIGMAAAAVEEGRPGAGVRLFAAATTSSPSPWRATQMEYELYLNRARNMLPKPEFEAEQAAGRVLSLEQAVEFASHLPTQAKTVRAVREKSGVLSRRECEVAALIAQGKSNGEIAAELVLSKRTVEKHIANILSKLNLSSRAQLVRWWLEDGPDP